MEVIIPKSELKKCGQILKAAKLTKAAKKASVTLIAAEYLTIIGPGFNQILSCKSVKWGTVLLPYSIWEYLFKTLSISSGNEVTVEAEDGRIKIGNMEITGPEIKVTRKDLLPLEIPLNAKPVDILQMFSYGPDRLRSSGIWNPVLLCMIKLRQQLRQAAYPLEEYGIKSEDLAIPIAQRLGIENQDEFVKILFSEQTGLGGNS